MKKIFAVLLMISLALTALPAQKALVIGNSGYATKPLIQPKNDAALIEGALSNNGWEVNKYENLDAAKLKKAIIDFGKSLKTGEIALVYYTGSAIQLKGINYLVPVGSFKDEASFKKEAVDFEWMLAQIGKAEVGLVFIDAARSPANIGYKIAKPGIAALNKGPANTLIMYSSPVNTVVIDAPEPNSYFASALAEMLVLPDLDLSKLSSRVYNYMAIKHGDKAPPTPWSASSLENGWVLNPSGENMPRFRFRGILKAIPDGGGSYSF